MKDVAEKGQDIYATMNEIVMTAMNKATTEGHNVPDVLYIGINAVAGAIAPLAALIGFTPKLSAKDVTEEKALEAINNTSMLVAALLTAKVTNHLPNGNTAMDFGPHQIFKAIDAAQRILGSDPRSSLSKPMVKAADQFRTPERLGNSWNVNNTPSSTEDERPRYLN